MGDDERQKKYIKVGMEYVTKVSKKIMENLEGEEQETGLENMRTIMKVQVSSLLFLPLGMHIWTVGNFLGLITLLSSLKNHF